MKDKEIYIYIVQTNGRDCWINPRHIVRVNRRGESMIELLLTNSQIVDFFESNPINEEMTEYLDLNRKKVL